MGAGFSTLSIDPMIGSQKSFIIMILSPLSLLEKEHCWLLRSGGALRLFDQAWMHLQCSITLVQTKSSATTLVLLHVLVA
eukprot:g14868.t1